MSHLEILTSVPRYHHRHWYRQSKSFFLVLRNYFLKIRALDSTLLFWLSYFVKVSLCYTYSFLYDFLFINQRRLFLFYKKAAWTFASTRLLVHILGLPGSFPKCCLEEIFCGEPVSACFCRKELHNTCYLRNFFEF